MITEVDMTEENGPLLEYQFVYRHTDSLTFFTMAPNARVAIMKLRDEIKNLQESTGFQLPENGWEIASRHHILRNRDETE